MGIDPGYACSYNNRGLAFGFKGDYNRARADYNQAIRLDPKFALGLQQSSRRLAAPGGSRPHDPRFKHGDPS